MRTQTIIGVAGGSGSGKTTFTNKLVAALGTDAMSIAHDNYYRARHDIPFEERVHLNYDHPEAYETELLVEHLKALKQGKAIACPTYDFAAHNRSSETIRIEPTRVVVVEGILILCDRDLRNLMDIRVFVEADADTRILRRLIRDISERGRSAQNVMEQYLTTVKPMHNAFVEPSKRHADLVVTTDGYARMDLAVDMLAHYVAR